MYFNVEIFPSVNNILFYLFFWLQESFPESFFLHALALKGNSLRGVLRIANASGLGGECASFPEAIHALSVGFAPQKVVFDSPCKTKVCKYFKKKIEVKVKLIKNHYLVI